MFDPSETSPESLKIAVQHAGFDMITDTEKDPSEISEEQFAKSYRKLKINVISAAVMSVAMFCIGMFCADYWWSKYAVRLLSTVTVFAFGRRFFIGAWIQLRHFSANMDTLVATSTLRMLAY